MRRARQPWFAVVWLNDVHIPYQVPGGLQVQSPDAALSVWQRLMVTKRLRTARRMLPHLPRLTGYLQQRYAHAVSYADQLLGRLAEEVSRGALGDETLFIATADHGDMLGGHGLMGHGELSGMYQPLIHVPLIMRGPDVAPAVSPARVQMADITQTVAAVAGVADKLLPTAVERVDLHAAAAGHGRSVAFCERRPLTAIRLERERRKTPDFDFTPHLCDMTAAIADGWKLILCSSGHRELYHLAADPDETQDLFAAQPARVAYLRSLIADFHVRCALHGATTGLARDDSRIVDQRLRDLGYL